MLWARKAKRARPFDDFFSVRQVSLDDPLAGVPLFWTVPDDWYVRLTFVEYSLTTAAGIGNRYCYLQVTRENVEWRPVMTNIVQGPSNSYRYRFSIGVSYVRPSVALPHAYVPLPHLLYLVPGDLLWLYAQGLQGNDRIHYGKLQLHLWEI